MEHNIDATVSQLKAKNASLKGRKRFTADLGDMRAACKQGFALDGLSVIGMFLILTIMPYLTHVLGLRQGEDDDTIEFTVLHGNQHLVSIVLITGESPRFFSCFFCVILAEVRWLQMFDPY